jgi:putative hydrolase of the HAD superfamily
VPADLTHIDTWLFDLDHTLYPADAGLAPLVEARMNAFIMRKLGLSEVEAKALRDRYFLEHGATLGGLVRHHGVDGHEYLEDVHEVPLDALVPEPALRKALQRLPGRRLVFTNAGGSYAQRVLSRLGIEDLFEDVFHLGLGEYVPKPHRRSFEALLARHPLIPQTTCFFEDMERNLQPAADLGMTTVLVGPRALASEAAFVHHRTATLASFLAQAQVREGRRP